jgi:hypothetical protein
MLGGRNLSLSTAIPSPGTVVRRWAPLIAVVAVAALVFTVIGWSDGAPATVGPGATEQGQGADVGEKTPVYWPWEETQLWSVPTPAPTRVSTALATPTLLPAAAASYVINPATAGNASVRWTFEETTAAPLSTEFELKFTDGLSRAAVSITVYLETRPTAPTAAVTFILYWDAGTFAPAGITVQTMQVLVQTCTSIGHCP